MKLQIPDNIKVQAVDVDRLNSKKKRKKSEWVQQAEERIPVYHYSYTIFTAKEPLQLNFCVAAASQCEKNKKN